MAPTARLAHLEAVDVIAAARRAGAAAAERAPALDQTGAFPAADVLDLHRLGLLAASIPAGAGGRGLGSDRLGSGELLEVLRLIGRGNLALGRLYEGHVNAWRLIARHGDLGQQRRLAADCRAGMMFAVWNTGPAPGMTLGTGGRLVGEKNFASGAGSILRPLITVRTDDGAVRMVVPPLVEAELAGRADLSGWRAQGMHASVSGRFDFTGLRVGAADLIGGAGDYEREPDFSAGAWRFAAVQLGGIEALAEAATAHLEGTRRDGDPFQQARVGQMALAAGGAHLWLERATAAVDDLEPAAALALVRLTRLAVERAGLDVLELAQRGIGVQAFLQPHPAERLMRDLATYLRQPAPDRALTEAGSYLLAGGPPPWR